MKKILFTLVVLFSFCLIGTVNAQDIKSIKMDINLTKDGVAHVTEYWTVYFNQNEDLTEVYKPYYNYGESSFENFKVSLNGRNFTFKENWDIDAGFLSKSYKNGFNYIDDGIELCFGISKKGVTNTYKMTYDITNFVAQTTDADMVYWTLVPHKLADQPEKVYIKIHSDFRYDQTLPVWGFGNYGGTAYVYDGYIEMAPENGGPLASDEYMTILIQFPQGTFTNSNNLEENFDHYLSMAKKGSTSYKKSSSSNKNFVTIATYIAIIVAVIGGTKLAKSAGNSVGSKTIKFPKGEKNLPKEVNYFREIPFNKDIFYGFWVSSVYKLNKNKTDFLGALFLKWIKEDKLSIEKVLQGKVFKKEKSALVLKQNLDFDNRFEKEFYDMIYEASRDGVLEAGEFKNWASDNYKMLYDWFDDALDGQTNILVNNKKLEKLSLSKFMTTGAVREDGIILKGLKKYLLDFSQIHDKNPLEVKLWQEYLMFAQVLGIAKKVAKEFKDLYPDLIPDDYMNDFEFVYFVSYSGMTSAGTAKARAESYSSGGGGFSSGGGGFGSFGGGGAGGGGGR